MSDAPISPILRVPTIYFIDDSATMREVIKIAFRKESIHVIACHDAASALTLFAESKPDAVITDVIMPDKDGYEVCRFVKQNPELRATPVILMSGVVNRQVAEKAMEAGADELMRKPFQPQELVTRVKNLLNPKPAVAETNGGAREDYPASAPSASLSNLFVPPMQHDTRFEERRTVAYAAPRKRSNFREPNRTQPGAEPRGQRGAKRGAIETALRNSPPGNAGEKIAGRTTRRKAIQRRAGIPTPRPARNVRTAGGWEGGAQPALRYEI
jgi:DNA-binding response OmpR family regulator